MRKIFLFISAVVGSFFYFKFESDSGLIFPTSLIIFILGFVIVFAVLETIRFIFFGHQRSTKMNFFISVLLGFVTAVIAGYFARQTFCGSSGANPITMGCVINHYFGWPWQYNINEISVRTIVVSVLDWAFWVLVIFLPTTIISKYRGRGIYE